MKKKSLRRGLIAILLIAAALIQTIPAFAAEEPGMSVFTYGTVEPAGYTDVPAGSWYYTYVNQLRNLDLMRGMSGKTFEPKGTVPISQAVTVAVRVYEKYHGIESGEDTYAGAKWYEYAMLEAAEYGILPQPLQGVNPNRAATRAEVAAILYNSLPPEEFAPLNTVDSLPDYLETDTYGSSIYALYRAGILTGFDEFGTFKPNMNIARSELAALLVRLTNPSLRMGTAFKPVHYEEIVYGRSGGGAELKAYRFGDGKNVMIVTFAIHGFEDFAPKDGQYLTYAAEKVMQKLKDNPDVIAKGDWSVYILPCANPDGTYSGWSNNGPGRRTLYHLDGNGNVVYGNGVDLNRCFPYCFYPNYSSRFYTGPNALGAPEAVALAEFTKSVKGPGKNVCIDTHGWFQQIIVSGGANGRLYRLMKASFPENYYTSLAGARGYYSAWAGYVLGYDACLFEFPGSFSSESGFKNGGLPDRYAQAILKLLREY